MTADRSSPLFQFFAGWFHQDWMYDGSPDDVLAAFLAEPHAPGELARLADQIDEIVAAHPDDAALERVLADDLGCDYVPSGDGRSACAWLRHVASRMRDTQAI
jgi:hypothetical protein